MKLESNHPAPAPGRSRTRYPWAEMEVGQSFFVRMSELPASGAASVRTAAWHWKKSRPGWDFTTKREKGGYRVWRVA